MLTDVRFSDGTPAQRKQEAARCIAEAFAKGLGVIHVSLTYTAEQGYRVIGAKRVRSRGGAYKPGDAFPKNEPPLDYVANVRAAMTKCGLTVV